MRGFSGLAPPSVLTRVHRCVLDEALGRASVRSCDMANLLDASRAAFADWPDRYGFRIVADLESARASSVSLVKDCVVVRVACDWLEGEMFVSVRSVGGAEVPLAAVVNLDEAHGLSMIRMKRGISRGMLEARLRQIADLLEKQASELLGCGPA